MASSYLFNTEQTLDSIEAKKKANNTPQTWSPTDWWDGFKEENLFTNAWEYFANNEDYPAKDGYLYSEDKQLEGMEDFYDHFFFSRSPEESAAIKAKLIERAEQNYASPWYYLGRVSGAFADPSTLLLWTKAGQSAKVFGSAMIAEEFAKQNMDPIRDDSYTAWVAGIGIGVPAALSLFKTRPSAKVQQEMKVLDKKWNEGITGETLYRGSGGEAKINIPAGNVFDDSLYAVSSKDIAKMYGKNIENINKTLSNPLIIKSDKDFIKFFETSGKKWNNYNIDIIAPWAQKKYKELRAKGISPEKAFKIIDSEGAKKFGYEYKFSNFYMLKPFQGDIDDFTKAIVRPVLKQAQTNAISKGVDGIEIRIGINKGGKEVFDPNALKGIDKNKYITAKTFSHDQTIFFNRSTMKEVLVDGKWIDPYTKVSNSSVGAAATKQSARDDITIGARQSAELEGQKFVETKLKWFGEDGPWTPVFRLTKTQSNIARNMVADLLDTPLLKLRNTEKWGYEATGKSLETDLRMYQVHEIESLKFIKDQYLKYLKANKQSVPKSEIGIMLKNTMNNDGVFSLSGFSKEVTKAMVMGEHAVPEVAQAARFSKKNFYDRLFKEANELKIREQPILHELNFWKYTLQEMKRTKSGKKTFPRPSENTQYTYSRTEIENIIDTLTDALNNIKKNPDGVKDYINIVYNKDAILANKARFKQIIVDNFKRRLDNGYIKQMPSAKVIDDIVEDLSNHFPFKAPNKTAWKEVQNGMDLLIQRYAFNRPRYARALRRRTLNLDKQAQLALIEGNFMVNDIFALQKIYYRSITPDILLTRKYGDTGGLGLNYIDEASSATFPGIKQVFQEYQMKTFRAKTKKEKIALQKEKFQALNDLEASVDLIRGTFGVPANPHAWYSRGMRMFKHYNALTMLTGFMAAIPDTARVVMTSGIKRGFQTQFEMFSKGFKQNSIFAMGKREAQSFGEALDMITGQRAMLFSDIGDMFGMGNKLEAGLGKVSQMNFMYVNLMSRWTEFAKSTASVTIGSRILEDSLKWAKGQPLANKWKTALAASGIDKGMATRIATQLEKHGAIPGGKGDIGLKYNYIANSSMWDDALAKNAFGAAMNKEINRTIVTPSKGDTPLWMSNQFGSTWAQFKKFAMGAQQRMLMRGMQERDLDFLFGSMLLIGSGMMIDAIYHKYRFQRDYGKLSMTQKLLNAFDRSGLGGIYMDINKAIETLTDNRIGIAPFLGSRRPYSPSGRWIAGTLGGPTAGQIYNIFDIMYDVGGNKYNHHTAKNVRRLIPFQNVWYLDWLFDGAEKGLRFK